MLYNLDTDFIISLCLIDLITFGATILLLDPDVINWAIGITLIVVVIVGYFYEQDMSEEQKEKLKNQAANVKQELKWELI